MVFLYHGVGYYRSKQPLGPACWAHYDLLTVLHGGFHFILRDREISMKAGDALLIPAHIRFEAVAEETGGTIWVCHFKLGKSKIHKWLPDSEKHKALYYPSATRGRWAQALLERISELNKQEKYKEEQAKVLELLLSEIRNAPILVSTSIVQKAIEEAKKKHWKEATLLSMATVAGLSPSHFRVRFQKEMNETVGNFLKLKRLEYSRELLTTTDMPIKEISSQVGYSEPAAYYHAFKTVFGTSPAKFRQRYFKVI